MNADKVDDYHPPGTPRGAPGQPARPAVLIVEDDPLVRRELPPLLKGHEIDVYLAEDMTEAVSLAELHQPSVVVMDLHMGAADTWRALQAVCGPIALIMTSLLTSRHTAERLHAFAYVSHVDLDAVVTAVRGACQRAVAEPSPTARAASALRSDAELLSERSRRLLDKSRALAEQAANTFEQAQHRLNREPAD